MKVLLVYKTFCENPHISHQGLGISALGAVKLLQSIGLDAEAVGVFDGYDLEKLLHNFLITHVVLYAPWIDIEFLEGLCKRWPNILFTVTLHSNIAFLQSDTFAIKVIREGTELSNRVDNFLISANSHFLVEFIQRAYGPCVGLPNLYPVEPLHTFKYNRPRDPLRIGLFGATRPLKNILTGVGAAILLSKLQPVHMYLSGERVEGGEGIMASVHELAKGHKHFKLTITPWYEWFTFRKFVGTMDALVQPSFSESFNNVTADGIVQGVPSVVSPAITWVPDYWKANPDDVEQVSDVLEKVLDTPSAPQDGLNALEAHNTCALEKWIEFLMS